MGAITWKVFHISFSNLLCMLLMTSSRTSTIMAGKKKWPIYCDFSHFTSIIWPCRRDNLKSFSHILFKFVMHVTNDQFSDKFNNGRKKKQLPIYCDFSHFTSIIWPCGRDKLKSFSHILFKLVMHVTNKYFLDKFNNGRKKKKMADLLRFFSFYVNNLTLWAR